MTKHRPSSATPARLQFRYGRRYLWLGTFPEGSVSSHPRRAQMQLYRRVQPPAVRARRSDDRAAVRVPNQDYGTADPLQSPSHVGDILGVRIEPVLRCDHLMSLGQKGRDEFAEARAVCPEAVDEDD